MSELTLVGLHEDGEHVVLEGPDGQRFRLPIDDALRAAVRRDRAQLEQVRTSGSLPPREIQARIRAGATAEEVADEAGLTVAHVRRYEGPVLAEREYVAQQARATRIGREAGAPTLGDLVADRLATRGVETGTTTWDASRGTAGPWTVEVAFVVNDAQRSARWTFDAGARTVRAVDDEARWLSETELSDEPIPRRHLAAVRSSVFDVEVDDALRPVLASVDVAPAAPEPEEDPHAATHALLDDLVRRRGVRQPVDEDAEDDDAGFEGFGPQHAFDFEHPGLTTPDAPAAHPPASRPDLATDATVLALPSRSSGPASPADEPPSEAGTAKAGTAHAGAEPGDAGATAGQAGPGGGPAAEEPGTRRVTRKGRASVPSWDEIVFGAKPE